MASADVEPFAFDLKRQREALEQLRREVQALDDAGSYAPLTISRVSSPAGSALGAVQPSAAGNVPTAASASSDVASASVESGRFAKGVALDTQSTRLQRARAGKVEHSPRLEKAVSELESNSKTLATELEEAERELKSRTSDRDSAKAEWSKALAQSAAAEGRDERRLVTARKELDEARQEDLQHDAAFRFEREKLRQRLRNLRMQLRQTERQVAEAEEEEQFREIGDGCDTAASDAGALDGRRASVRGDFKCRRRVSDARRSLKCLREDIVELRQRRDELTRGEIELREREQSLKKMSRLSDNEIDHWERRAEFKLEESRLQSEQAQLRQELRAVEKEASSEQHEAARHRASQERALAEMGERELVYKEQHKGEMEDLQTIDEYLSAEPDPTAESRQALVAEWIEADIGVRQVEHVKRRLTEIVSDASARAQVLEQAVEELHADLDKRAAIIIELVERQGGGGDVGSQQPTGVHGKPSSVSAAVWTPSIAGASCLNENGPSDADALDRQALEAELAHQRGLFELRGKQVLGLEQRLAALLARESPRVHESSPCQRLEAGAVEPERDSALQKGVQVLEQAITELHADLDKRAAIIIELVERQGGGGDAGSQQQAGIEGRLSSVPASSSTAAVPGGNSYTGNGPVDADALEMQALEAELAHQRGLFELRGKQVLGLEQRLAALLAREAPRVHALRAWVAVHEPLSWKRLEACAAESERESVLRADVQAMREHKSARLAEVESEWRAQKSHMAELGGDARRNADEAATRAAALQRRKEGLLKTLDRLLKAEGSLSTRAAAASQAVERDQRRLVDLTARQLGVASAAAARESNPGCSSRFKSNGARAEAARQALVDAREVVEESRARQINVLVGIRREVNAVGSELREVTEAIDTAECGELKAQRELSEAEKSVEAGALEMRRSSRRASSIGVGPKEIVSGGSSSSQAPAPAGRLGRTQGRPRTPTAQSAASAQRLRSHPLQHRRNKLEQDLESAQLQLRTLEQNFEDADRLRREQNQLARDRVEEASEALACEKTKQKQSSSGVLKRYRASHAAMQEAEHRCGDLRSRAEAVNSELTDARHNLEASHERRQRRLRQEQAVVQRQRIPNPDVGAEVRTLSSILWGSVDSHPRSVEEEPSQPPRTIVHGNLPSATPPPPAAAAAASTAMAGSLICRALPSIAEVRQKSEGNPELYTFYLQVLPLLKGVVVGSNRRAKTVSSSAKPRFEPRQLLLSSDLRRLELWPADSCTMSCATGAALGGSVGSGGARKRVAEAWLRIETLERVHVSKATLAAVQQAIAESAACAHAAEKADSDEQRNDAGDGEGWFGSNAVHVLGPPVHGQPSTRNAANGEGVPSRHSFPFDFVLSGVEPWRLQATDVHTFHVVTSAVSTLLAVRGSLPAFAIALGLGATTAL